MQDYRKIEVWQRAHQFTLDVYKQTESFPSSERYSLTDQLRRAAVSIPSNIAEGSSKSTSAEFHRYLDIASGSAGESDYLLLLSRDLKYILEVNYQKLLDDLTRIRKMLVSFRKSVKGTKG